MENVVYFLGAGFSAPLGLPLVSNFIEKSRDLYFGNKSTFAHFEPVLSRIKKTLQSYYHSDEFNIEEVLSILEMTDYFEGGRTRISFGQYILDVINRYTPKNPDLDIKSLPGNWESWAFGKEPIWNWYGYFVSSLFSIGLELTEVDDYGLKLRKFKSTEEHAGLTSYSVVTVNYDMVFENYVQYINTYLVEHRKLSIIGDVPTEHHPILNCVPLAKLHGSVGEREIILPTWNKGIQEGNLPKSWESAFKILTQANHIRIIGYSLPTTDSYVKYLLKAAVLESPNLKTIDVLCLDSDGKTYDRYTQFIKYSKARFANEHVEDYLGTNFNFRDQALQTKIVRFNKIEQAHERFFGEKGRLISKS